jgi:Ca2+-binding RTX toxin-like protein
MPRVEFQDSDLNRPVQVLSYIEDLLLDSDITSFSGTSFRAVSGDLVATVSGSGFTRTGETLTGGTISEIQLTDDGMDYALISDVGNVGPYLRAASNEDRSFQAIEKFLMKLDWTWIGTSVNDQLLEAEGTVFGTPINFRGDDVYRAGGGPGVDTIYLGAGKDKAIGGGGEDRLYGGAGNDRLVGGGGVDDLYGGGGKDRLFGGSGDDILTGEGGNDRLYGGASFDTLEGGAGRDIMVGGGGDDLFLFNGRTGADRINDFQFGDDSLLFLGGNTRTGVSEVANGVLIEHTGGTILIVGGDIADWT